MHMFSSTKTVYVRLMVGALNPFTVKVIINMYDPITIFLIEFILYRSFPCLLFPA